MPRTSNTERAPRRGAAQRAHSSWRWSSARRRVAAVGALLAGALLWGAPAHAATVPATGGGLAATGPNASALPETLPSFISPDAKVKGHLLDVTPSTKPVSAGSRRTSRRSSPPPRSTGSVSVAQGAHGVVVVAARTTAGHLEVFTSGANAKGWTASDVTVLGTAPLAAGTPAVVVDPSGVTRVFFRIRRGRPRRGGERPHREGPLVLLGPHVQDVRVGRRDDRGRPSRPRGPRASRPRSTRGRRPATSSSFSLTSDPTHPWYYVDVSALAEGPTIVGTPGGRARTRRLRADRRLRRSTRTATSWSSPTTTPATTCGRCATSRRRSACPRSLVADARSRGCRPRSPPSRRPATSSSSPSRRSRS